MKFLIVNSHPYEKSFNRQLTQSIVDVLVQKHEVEVIDLVKDGFNPVMGGADLRVFAKGEAADLKIYEYQKKIKEADVLVFAFPIWWSLMPAILKGFFDKVFLKEFAYTYNETGLLGLLDNKKAVVVTTMETEKSIYNNILNSPVQNQLINGTLGMCHIQTEKYFQIDKINSGTDEYRKDEYSKIVQYFGNM
jgi:NAD(P)H dehydrogenase (quinone)